MAKKVISMLLVFILSFSLCTVAFAVDSDNYNVFDLPVISDKMPENKQVSKVELYVDKETETAFVDLEDISDLIGATCNFKKDWYDVRRDYTYLKYNSAEDMKLYLSNSSNGLLLLDGKLFESRMINNRWYVDYIKFCDMFGVNLIKVDKTTATIDDLPNYHFNEFENEMNFDENPYYIFMYTGTTLSSLYEKLMKYRSSYFWNYSSWARDDVNFLQKPFYSKYGIASGLMEGSIYSNVVNEWGTWTSKIVKEYNSEEQYAETLLNVCNINYSNYSTVDSDSYTKADSFYAFVKNVNKVNKSNKIIKKIIENSDLKDDFPEFTEEAKYFGIFTNVMNTAKASVQAFNDTQNFYNRLNNINQEKVDLLKYSIIDNNKLNSQTSYRNVVNNVLTAVEGRFGSRVILNSLDNPVGLVDSANKLYNIYNDKNAQFIEALNKSLEDGTYYVSDIVLKKALNSNAKTKMIAIGMSMIDKFMSWAKSSYGGVLKDVQNVYQYYYIEQSILNDLDEKNPEILYNRLVMALQASLCIYNSSEEMVGKSYDQEVIDIANMLETLETGKNDHILNVNYYRDPRNNNVSDEIKNSVLNYKTESEKIREENVDISSYVGKFADETQTKTVEISKVSDKKYKIDVRLSNSTGTRVSQNEYQGEVTANPFKFSATDTYSNNNQITLKFDSGKIHLSNKLLKFGGGLWSATEQNDIELNRIGGDLYAAYLKVVNELISEYGEGNVINDKSNGSDNNWCLNGLGVVRLIDFDGDGKKELLCVCGKYDSNTFYNYTAKIKLYSFIDNQVVLVYDSGALFYGADPKYHLEYLQKDGKVLLHTKSAYQTVTDDEWSELKNNKMNVVKKFRGTIEIGTGNWKYEIDGKSVSDGNAFYNEIKNFESGKIDYMLNDNYNYEELKAILSETNVTLQKLGYKFNIVQTDWQSKYKNFLNEKLVSTQYSDDAAFELYDVDEDGVPELFVSPGEAHLDLCKVYSIVENEFADLNISSQYGSIFADSSKHLIISSGTTNQSGRFWHAYYEKSPSGCKLLDTVSSTGTVYTVNDKEVSKEQYDDIIQKYNSISAELGRKYKLNESNINTVIDNWATE
ncbi:MAG: hypothetical protein IJ192_12915 [Clostridia bacterium]|nr:hypothetical protein [Clostridia bacterium]